MSERQVGEPQEIVLRDSSRPLDSQWYAFRGWKVAHVYGDIGLANETPECAIFEAVRGRVFVAFRDRLPDDDPEEFDDNLEWSLVGECEDRQAAETWGMMNEPDRGLTGLLEKACTEAWGAPE